MICRFSQFLLIGLFLFASAIAFTQNSVTRSFQTLLQQAKSVSFTESVKQSSEISEIERRLLITALVLQLPRAKPSPEQQTRQKLIDEVSRFGVKATSLGTKNGDTFFLVQGSGELDCSPTGNCSTWIFRRSAQGYAVILYGIGQTVLILPHRTDGLSDIVLRMHGSAYSSTLKVYRFQRARYRRLRCYEEDFQALGTDGEYHDLDEVRITPCKK